MSDVGACIIDAEGCYLRHCWLMARVPTLVSCNLVHDHLFSGYASTLAFTFGVTAIAAFWVLLSRRETMGYAYWGDIS